MEPMPVLAAIAAPWVERLKLQDWNIRWEWARHHELDHDKAGNLAWNLERRSARIQVLVESDRSSDGVGLSTEEIIVHELLHIVFSMLDDDLNATANTLYERALNATAAAMVNLAQEGRLCKELNIGLGQPIHPPEGVETPLECGTRNHLEAKCRYLKEMETIPK